MATKNEKRPLADFNRIKDQISVEDVLGHYGVLASLKRSGSDLRGPCPIHGGDPKKRHFSVFHQGTRWRCHGECDSGGNVLDLVMQMENCSIREAGLKIAEWFNLSAQQPGGARQRKAGPGEAVDDKATPGRTAQASESGFEADADDEWWVEEDAATPNPPLDKDPLAGKLGFDYDAVKALALTPELAESLGVGYADKGIMRGRVAVQVHNKNGELVAYVGVDPNDPGNTQAYRWPKDFAPELELYNAHRIAGEKTIAGNGIIVVSGFDDICVLFGAGVANAVAVLTQAVSDQQLDVMRSLLNSTRPPRIVYAHKEEEPKGHSAALIAALSSIAWVRVASLENLIT